MSSSLSSLSSNDSFSQWGGGGEIGITVTRNPEPESGARKEEVFRFRYDQTFRPFTQSSIQELTLTKSTYIETDIKIERLIGGMLVLENSHHIGDIIGKTVILLNSTACNIVADIIYLFDSRVLNDVYVKDLTIYQTMPGLDQSLSAKAPEEGVQYSCPIDENGKFNLVVKEGILQEPPIFREGQRHVSGKIILEETGQIANPGCNQVIDRREKPSV